MTLTVRDKVKRTAGQIACLAPQARYDRGILVLSHMRAATTALSNVICSHGAVSGYGETHVPHHSRMSPGLVIVNLALRRAYSPGAEFFFDKVLHNRLDIAPPPAFYQARAIFMIRRPAPAVKSISNLAAKTGMAEYVPANGAATYYAERVEHLSDLWDSFAPEKKLGLTAEALLTDPEAQVARIGGWLSLTPELKNEYVSHGATQKGGGGDPLRSAGLTQIEASPKPEDTSAVDGVSDALSERCHAAFEALVTKFGAAT
ncbi:sulfotransferase family protein [Pseudooceanicola sp. C21-150M6]|uniref:sulfotransferase family protein n=1 Tax=Pseudooceanicola sp. C21-150M6 TaxID=3434355 RepID=UPI003D7FBB91